MRLIVISNRLPLTLTEKNGKYEYKQSVGGLATGIMSYLDKLRENSSEKVEYVWLGWPGLSPKTESKKKELKKTLLEDYNCFPVFFPEKAKDKFYNGFCNKTIWPLFHYFTMLTVYDDEFWNQYKLVNEEFKKAVMEIIQEGDIIWVHDYHLMLLPELIRKSTSLETKIGYFLHIPFPAYELFRLLPREWAKEILNGLLGSDIIGFHTHDYTKYFMTSVLRILGYEHNMGKILLNDRVVLAETYPMGIDFKKFSETAKSEDVEKEIQNYRLKFKTNKLILSIDRLDYTKGLINRLKGYESFLKDNPNWIGKVNLLLIVVPSREGVEHYQSMKKQIDELVGKINGHYGTLEWQPIIYQYRSFVLNQLVALYSMSDAMLVTPLRDGMNLVAKEYIASKVDKKGVLILSEMAGAASELGESVQVNPNDISSIALAIQQSLEMPVEEQVKRNTIMQKRLKRYNITKWATDFIDSIEEVKKEQKGLLASHLSNDIENQIIQDFHSSNKKALFFDYDGTLVPLASTPEKAVPGHDLLKLLEEISNIPGTDIFIISGRDKEFLEKWFGSLRELNFVAEHGIWKKEKQYNWELMNNISVDWMSTILPILELYSDRVPGSFVEEKEYSLAWHFRKADVESGPVYAQNLIDSLQNLTARMELQILRGNKVIEIKNSALNKGTALNYYLRKNDYDFVLVIGDDVTDDDMFKVQYEPSYSVKVGLKSTHARYSVYDYRDVRNILEKLLKKEDI